ncbi:MAG: hypothetical protein RLZZ511_3015 [Cyanobacteriota bacterium]|jgi:hypothetical protein
MPHELVTTYLTTIEQAILTYPSLYVDRYVEEILTPDRANLRIRLRTEQDNLLEINEAIVVTENQLTTLDYRYHYQDHQNQLIFRYDSTPHFPNLPTFPHHKHRPQDVIASEKPSIQTVLQEVMSYENP